MFSLHNNIKYSIHIALIHEKCSKRFTRGSPQAVSTTVPFSIPWGALERSWHYKWRVTLAYRLKSGTSFTHEWGEEMHVKSLFQGLNVDLAQPRLEPGTSWSRSQVSTTRPRRHKVYVACVFYKLYLDMNAHFDWPQLWGKGGRMGGGIKTWQKLTEGSKGYKLFKRL